jgi:hypothetical protein
MAKSLDGRNDRNRGFGASPPTLERFARGVVELSPAGVHLAGGEF